MNGGDEQVDERGQDPSVEAELGNPPARIGGKLCPECGVEPSVNGGRCWTCRGLSMMEADSWEA